jgi:hypothetical protein
MSPEEGMKFLRQFYSREVGNYYLALEPESEPPALAGGALRKP